jgi:DNA mismatch repair protein MutS
MATEKLTPMMRQYRRIQAELPPGTILMFRLGDFYEMFFDDAREVAPILGVALTRRQGVPMCGVPYHALDGYLAKLVRAGRKAAICDQVEDPATAKGIVRREVTRVVTPGTITEESILDAASNNYLAAVHAEPSGRHGLALLDLSTGEFILEACPCAGDLRAALLRVHPSEVLVAESANGPGGAMAVLLADAGIGNVTAVDDWTASYDAAYDTLARHYGVHSLEGFGCEGDAALVCPAGALLHHVAQTLRHTLSHVRAPAVRDAGDYLALDESTCANLDLLPVRGRPVGATLLGVLDATETPMGARLLRNWIARPLRKADAINRRLDAVEFLVRQRHELNALRDALGGVRDIERTIARLGTERATARDLQALAASLRPVPGLRDRLAACGEAALAEIASRLVEQPALLDHIDRAIVDSPPAGVKDGDLIRPGYSADLDELRRLASEGHQWIAGYQAREQGRTGIKTLKVRHNRVFGFYIEISKGQAALAPPEYERRQTLASAERFTTPELKEYERKIFGAQDRAVALEYDLFCRLRDEAAALTAPIQATADALARLDVLASLADRALALGYVRPEVFDGDTLEIVEGRHPIVEQLPGAERFVPNDTRLDPRAGQIAIITGPNMAGKSTYIRQVALIVILAQLGSFVPVRRARIGVVDRVFTRVGAGDDIARGRSTFLVEMQETANILNNATPRSLIVLDEIGRGTSTFDGISIAWAVAEYLHNNPRVKAKTLFATHYHELTDLALTLPGVRNYTVTVRESGDQIAFLRRIQPGTADKSYGIHVARLAGLPAEVVARAREILGNLEEGELDEGLPALAKRSRRRDHGDPSGQLTLC